MASHAVRPAGSVIDGKYELVSQLGEGGMGVVYRARHRWTHREVAVKLLHPEFASNETVVARFLREARSAAALHHPNVVDVLDMGQDASGVYLALELLEGEPLTALVARRGKLPLKEALGYLLPVMDALAAAHRAGIVHRDLKPDNIFLARTHKGKTVPKLLDFGIAKVQTSTNSISTQGGMIIGTPAYMSPEQVRGAENVGATTDVWAVGIVLYECLTGVSPFFEEVGQVSLGRILAEDVPPIESLVPDLPADVCAVVGEALERDPERRHQRVDDFAAALRDAAGLSPNFGRSMPARAPASWPRWPSTESEPTRPARGPGSGIRGRAAARDARQEADARSLVVMLRSFLVQHQRWAWVSAAVVSLGIGATLLVHLLGAAGKPVHIVTPAATPPAASAPPSVAVLAAPAPALIPTPPPAATSNAEPAHAEDSTANEEPAPPREAPTLQPASSGTPGVRVRRGVPDVRGSLSKESIHRVAAHHLDEVRDCYELGLVADATLHGRTVIELVISPTGAVQRTSTRSSTLGDASVDECIERVARTWQFPPTDDGDDVVVGYPFVLQRDEQPAQPASTLASAPRDTTDEPGRAATPAATAIPEPQPQPTPHPGDELIFNPYR